jgi:hypothetical protein
MITIMNFRKKVVLVSVALGAFGMGCGHNYSGTYSGQEQVAMTGMSIPAVTATLSINQSNNDTANINWNGAGTLSAQVVDGNNLRINPGTLSAPTNITPMVGVNPTGYPTGYPNPGYPITGAPTACNVTGGSVTRNGDILNASLQIAPPTATVGAYVYNPCPTARSGSFRKQN